MSDDHKDVLIAAYLFEDLAKRDYDSVLKLAEDKTIKIEGVAVVQKNDDGEVHGRNLVPVFVESGAELLRFFDIDATRLMNVLESAMPPKMALTGLSIESQDQSPATVTAVSFSPGVDHWLNVRMQGVAPTDGERATDREQQAGPGHLDEQDRGDQEGDPLAGRRHGSV